MVIVLSDILARIQPCFLEWGQWTVVNQPKKIRFLTVIIGYHTEQDQIQLGERTEREREREIGGGRSY